MASAPDLALGHRRSQLALRAILIGDLLKLWPAFDPTRVDETFPAWAFAVAQSVAIRRDQSSALALAYLRQVRALQQVDVPMPAVLAEPLDTGRLVGNLRITSAVSVKAAATQGVSAVDAATTALVASTRAATRLALEGGRETIARTAVADPAAKGYRRVASASACDFCLMLSGRRRLYHTLETASRAHDGSRYHDGCGCTTEPVY